MRLFIKNRLYLYTGSMHRYIKQLYIFNNPVVLTLILVLESIEFRLIGGSYCKLGTIHVQFICILIRKNAACGIFSSCTRGRSVSKHRLILLPR